jgi:hypothetical protein
MKNQENQFLKITGILAYPESAIEVDISFGFLSKMELSDPLETCEIIHYGNFGSEFIKFLKNQIAKRKEGDELDINDILDVVEGELSDYYVDACRENGARVYLHLKFITEDEFNNSDKWENPTEKECRELLVNRLDD